VRARVLLATAAAGAVALLGAGCAPVRQFDPAYASTAHDRGTVESVAFLRAYPAWRLNALLLFAPVPFRLSVAHPVALYRVVYWTEYLGHPVRASGLIAVPDDAPPTATVMWLHGTNMDRATALSTPTPEGLLVSAGFAGAGYMLVAPDYIGQGLTELAHPYLFTPATVAASLDLLTASRQVSAGLRLAWRQDLFIAGASQGAHAALAVHRALEQTPPPEVRLRATAAMSAPMNMGDIGVPFALYGASPDDSGYLAWIAASYADAYGQDLTTVLKPATAAQVRDWIAHPAAHASLTARLPRYPRDMFQPDFLAGFDQRAPSWFRDALLANETWRWAPRAPVRIYYSHADLDVAARDDIESAAAMVARGGHVTLEPIEGEFGHVQAILRAVPRARAWFLSIVPGGGG